MNVLDTNVISGLIENDVDPRLFRRVEPLLGQSALITAVTVSELMLGVALMSRGTRREALAARYSRMFELYFESGILGFDLASAVEYADIRARRAASGRPMSQSDAQIAGTVRARGGTLWTRNVRDFEGCGIEVVNPWE